MGDETYVFIAALGRHVSLTEGKNLLPIEEMPELLVYELVRNRMMTDEEFSQWVSIQRGD